LTSKALRQLIKASVQQGSIYLLLVVARGDWGVFQMFKNMLS
jgi:hypothetical protein